MAGAFEIVMQERKALVTRIIGMMQQGYFFNAPEWNHCAMSPWNPLSQVHYKGGNRVRLMAVVADKHYSDPRWATARQYNEKGYIIRKGEHSVLCEKWIFEKKQRVSQPDGSTTWETVELERPQVSYFRVFNAQQVQDFPAYEQKEIPPTKIGTIIDHLIDTSECPVRETAQDKAYYSLALDEIVLPLRSTFKDEISFAKTLTHEMSHSTGGPGRLNRKMGGGFGSPQYAMEELRAEIGALFTETDLGIPLGREHYEDHSDYLKSWIRVLKNDYNEFFRACADAQKISERLIGNYTKKYELDVPGRSENSERAADSRADPAQHELLQKAEKPEVPHEPHREAVR